MDKWITPVVVMAVAVIATLYAIAAWFMLGLQGFLILRPELDVRLPISALISFLLAMGFTVGAYGLFCLRTRIIRIHGGLCVGCGYDCRASRGRCPECGQRVRRRKMG